ncbi:hypothetical protein J6590_032645 [Homalodisca vitripennis]|nr:hypothetical protein J6590_032645 [Homalodisca vitripennis]
MEGERKKGLEGRSLVVSDECDSGGKCLPFVYCTACLAVAQREMTPHSAELCRGPKLRNIPYKLLEVRYVLLTLLRSKTSTSGVRNGVKIPNYLYLTKQTSTDQLCIFHIICGKTRKHRHAYADKGFSGSREPWVLPTFFLFEFSGGVCLKSPDCLPPPPTFIPALTPQEISMSVTQQKPPAGLAVTDVLPQTDVPGQSATISDSSPVRIHFRLPVAARFEHDRIVSTSGSTTYVRS